MLKRSRSTKVLGTPSWRPPSPDVCAMTVARLARLHGMPKRPAPSGTVLETLTCGATPTILDALIRTLLSQNTTQANSTRAMQSFLATFGGDYGRVHAASVAQVACSIACGGLGNIKAQRIKGLIASLLQERGEFSLEHLRCLPDAEVKEALTRYPGVGAKTASCVLLFCLGRDSFAVDTHVFRIAKRLGWLPPSANREQAHALLDAWVPKHLHYPLHVLLIRHGKTCPVCAASGRPQFPPRGPCPLF